MHAQQTVAGRNKLFKVNDNHPIPEKTHRVAATSYVVRRSTIPCMTSDVPIQSGGGSPQNDTARIPGDIIKCRRRVRC
jgi:hypothetical protein